MALLCVPKGPMVILTLGGNAQGVGTPEYVHFPFLQTGVDCCLPLVVSLLLGVGDHSPPQSGGCPNSSEAYREHGKSSLDTAVPPQA